MKKRAFNVFGVAAFLIGGAQLFASELPPFEISFDESGSASYITSAGTAGVADSFFEEDGGTSAVVYRLPGVTWSGTVNVFGVDGDLDDVLVLTAANGGSGETANLLAAYSADGSGLPTTVGAPLASVTEAANGSFQYIAADGAVFDGAAKPSHAAVFISGNLGPLVPEPASVAMFLIGAVGIGLGVCRRKTRR